MNVRMPDGTVIRNVPDGTSQSDLQRRLDASRAPAEPAEPTEGGWSQFGGGIAHTGKEAYRAVKELAGGDTTGLEREAREYEAKPKGWQSTAGEMVGGAGLFAPLALLPGGLPVAIGASGVLGAATTPGGLEERLTGGALGAGGAAVGGALPKVLSRVAKPIGDTPADIAAMQARGIEPTFGQAMAAKGTAAGRLVGGAEEVAMNVPYAGAPLRAGRERGLEQWRQATRQEAMPPGAGAAPGTVDEVTAAVGRAYDDILDPLPMPRASVTYQPDIRQLTRGQALTNEQRQLLSETFEEIRLKHMQNPLSVARGPTAAAAQQAESELKTMGAKFTASQDPAQRELGAAFGNVATDFGNTWRGTLPTDTRNAIAAIDRRYPNLKAIQDAARRTGLASSEGDPNRYTPQALWRSSARADRTSSKRGYQRGEAPQQEMARLGGMLGGTRAEANPITRAITGLGLMQGAATFGLPLHTAASMLAVAGYGTRPIQQYLTGRAAPRLQQEMMEALRRMAPAGAATGAAAGSGLANL